MNLYLSAIYSYFRVLLLYFSGLRKYSGRKQCSPHSCYWMRQQLGHEKGTENFCNRPPNPLTKLNIIQNNQVMMYLLSHAMGNILLKKKRKRPTTVKLLKLKRTNWTILQGGNQKIKTKTKTLISSTNKFAWERNKKKGNLQKNQQNTT